MAALNWNDLSETPPNAVNWDELSDTPPKETSVPERVVNTGQALGRLAKDLPTHSLAYAANIKEGSRPLDKNDWADKATEDSSKLLNERLSASDANDKTLLGTKGDWAQTGASIPFSMGSIPAAIGAGGLATVVTKNPIAGYSAGATASGALAYRADSAMFMNSALNTFKDKYKAENNGVEPSQELMLAEQERLQPYAEDHGLWEAIPEGLGSAIGGKVVSSAFKNAGENLAVKAGKVIAGLAAEEMPSETVSQQGQYNTEIDAGVSEGEKRSFTSPSDIAQSVSEVAIPVAQQSLLMGGAAGVTSKAYDYAKERAIKLQETAKTGTLGRSIAAGDIAATDTVIQPDIEEKYAAPKANPAEQIENVDTEPAFEKRNSPYNDLFDAATIKHNLPDGLLNKIGHVESGFNPDAISPTGARGVMQFMPRTANEYGIDPHDTPAAIDAAGKKMAHLRDYYDGNITKAIAAYNYGEGNLDKVIDNHGDQWREHLPTETTNYLNKIIGGSNESKSSRVDSGSRSTNDVLATTVNKTKEEEPDYSSLSLDELENLHKKAIDANNDIDYEAIKKHLGEDEADNFLKLSERQKGNWWEKNADTAMEDDSSAFHGIDSDKILAHINAKNDFDIESPESLGRSIAFKMMNISSPDFKGSPDHTAIKSALEYAQDKGWDTQKIIKSARNKATEIAGADAPELFDTLFKKVENKANSEPIIKEQSKAIADQVTPIQLKENKLKSANDEKVEVKYGKNTFHVLKSELDSDAPILAAFNVKSGKQASFKLKRDKIELKDDQPTTITGNDAANGSDAERANGATDTGGAAQESNKGLTNPAQAATQPTETINGSKESTNEKRSLPTQEQERPLLNNEAPVQSGALSSGEFNPILKTKKTTWVKNRLKELQVKEGTAGYAKRLKEVQAEHANELEKAQASLPYEQFKALPDNEGIPDSLVRQAYDVLREDHGITTPIDTQAHESATSPNNDLPAPTPAQIEAGNYKKGHINLHGLDISIENPKGSTRSGTDKDGTPWENTMTSHYGYIKGSIGADKEHVDVFVGDNHGSDKAFVVNQNHPHNGKFDEHKVMLGFDTAEQAKEGYLKNYVDGWKGLGSITEIPVSELKDRIKSGALTKPIANSIAKTDESNGVSNKNDQFGEADLPKFIQNIDKHRRDLLGVDDHINKANTLLPFTESTIGDHPSIEHAVDFLNRRTDAYKHFDGRLLKGGSASQSLSLKDDLLPNWSQAKQIERSFEEWKKKYPRQAQKLKENQQNVLNLNKGDKVLFPNHGAKEGDPVHDTGEILKKNPKNWIIKSKNGVELHFQPSALKPVVEDSQVDNSRLEKNSDQKPETKQYHPAIESLSNDLVEGGGVSLIHNEHGTIIGRTPSLNPDWFKDGRFQIYKPDGEPYSSTPSVREVKQAVSDYKAGNKLKAKQVAILESLHDHLVSEEEANSNKKEEDLIYNHLEKEIESGNLTIDDVEEALDEFDNGVPFDVKGGNISINELEDWLGISNEKEESTGSTDKAQGEILQNYSESELAKHEREQADRARKSAEAEVKANQSNYGKANKVFTEDAANAARERLKAKLGRLNSGFDPEMMLDGMTLAGYHIEAGAKQYGAYAKAMIADLGEGIKPYLAHFYNAVRDYPGFDNKDMASYASLEASKKIGVYPGENWRYKNQQAREVTQVNEHYITFATRDNDGRDQESISNFIASKKDWSQTDNTHGQADNDYVKNGSNPQETHHDHSEANNTGTTGNITRDSSEAPIESGVSNSQSKKPNQNGTRQSKSRVRTRQGQYDSTDLNQSEGNGLLSEHEGLVGHETNESTERSIGGQTSADTGVSKSIGADNYSLLNKKPIALTPAKRRDVNILAEEILKKPVNEITEDDKNILRQYTGNGGLDVKASADKGEAIFNQHYSAYDTIKAMYGALMDAGIKMVNNLEPSVGSGNFIGMHPRANWTSVDIDKTNTEIVKRLYPDAKVFHESYETFRGKNYDLIISNVPFASFSSLAREHAGTIKPMFKAIHNFFFAQSIDKLKTGGVMAFMTSTGTMDGIGEGQRLRQHLVKHMDVIGAYRLPMGTQKANASTEVMIDVIFLQKRPEGVESKQPEKNNAFVNVTNKGGYKINQYFADYPESVLGELSVGANKTSMGKVGWIVTGDADYSRMKVEPQDYASTKKATQDRFAGPEEAAQYAEKQGLKFIDGKTTPFFKDGFVYDQLATYSEFSGGGLFGRKATGVNADKMAALQKIEETTDSDLVRSYENKYGKPPHTDKLLELWAKTNHAAKQLKAYLSLFDKHFNLSEIFTKKVRFENSGKIEINENSPLYDRAESLEDANGIFSTKNNLLSDDEMQGLLDSNDYAKLSNGHFQNARLYYAGNIYQKLDDVQKVKPATQRDKQIARLERVKPTLILIKDLTITGKEKWMPDSAIAAIGKQTYPDGTVIIGERAIDNNYFLHLFNQYLNNEPFVKKRQGDTPEEYAEQLKAAQNTLYSEVLPLIKQKLMDEGLSDEVVNAYNRAKNFFAPPSFDGSSLRNLPKTFRGKPFKLMRHQLEGAERAIYNKKGVLAFSPGLGKTPTAIVVADQLLQKGVMKKPLFIVPANTIPQWEATTRDLYPNAKVYEFPKYTSGINKGKPKDWPSMSAADKEKMVHDLTNNQYDYTFISTNLAQKITIPTDKLSQYVDDLAESISGMEKPDEELNKSQLKAKATRLAKIKMLKATIMASYAESNKNGFDMGKMGFDALFADEVQYYKNIGMQSEEAKGGIGANVAINAKYPLAEDEKGKLVQDKTQDPISVSLGSSRSYDFRFKTQFISEKNNGNNIFLLTGTPTPNKPLELMTLLHHLDIHILDEYGIDNVGDFVNEFLDVQEVEEIGVDGSAKLKPQLVSLQNIFGLKKIITRFIDYRSPESATDLTRPKQKDVTHIILQNETSEAIFADVQERILKSIEDANEKRSGNIVEAEQMIAMYSAGRDASVDVRLYTPSKIGKGSIAEGTVFKKETRSQYSKIAKTVELVAAKNKQDPEAGQLIFLDRLKFSDGSGSTHEDIRNDILEATGLSPQEVVFVNGGEYVNPKTGKIAKNIKPEMLQTIMDDYNAGKIKVLIGNTSKLGVGVDLQTTTTDIYQLDKPYRPDEIEQRNNRGVRQGNRNAEVTVHTFNQPGTFDAMSDRIIASKQGFNDVFWKDQASDKADVKGEEAPGHYDAAIELERDPVRKRKLEIERDLSQASAKTNNLEKQVSNLAKRIKSVTESKTQYKNANQGIDTREAPKYEDQTDAERKKSLAAWKQRQADQRALNVKRIGDLTEDLKTLEESKAQRIEELEAHKAHIASIRNQYVVNGVVNLDAIKNGGNQDAALFSKSTQTTNPHTLSSLTQTIKSIMDKAFGDGWTNRLLSTGKFKVISRDEAVGLIGKNAMFHKVWHGSPHDHDKFDSSKIGTGEGAQAFGYGHYFTDAKSIAEWYRDTLSGNMPPSVIFTINGKEFDTSEIENDEVRNEVERAIEYAHESDDVKYDLDSFMEDIISDAKNELEYTDEDDSEYIELNERISEATNIIKNANIDVSYPDGKLYEVDLAPSQDEYLDWDKPLSEQSDLVKSAIRNIQSLNSLPDNTKETLKFKQYGLTKPKSDGSDIYAMISSGLAYINGENAHKGNDNAASKLLQSLGIRGIRYKAEGGKSDSNNYVVFDDNDINIDAKYSKDGQVLAFYNPADDTTYFVHDNISQDQSADSIKGLMLHEIASHALKLGKSSAEFKSILARFEKLKAIDANIQAAFDRVPKDTNPEHATEEALSYYLEKNPRSTLDKRVIEWFRQAIRAIGNTLVGKDKYLFSKWANELTHTELVNMANKALKYAPESLQFDNVERELEDSPNLVFSKRTKSAPIKTIIAYKLFRIKKSKPGELFPLFVKMENDNPVPIGTWEDAEIGEQTNTGKVKSKLGPLAFRPGWHMGDSPASFHIGGNIGEGNKPTTRLNDQVWAEVEVSADIDYQPEANANARIGKNGQIVANTAHITDKLPVDGFYRYKTNANMVGNWIIAGSMKINRVLSDDEVSYIHDRLGTTHDLPRETPLDLKKLGFDNSNFDPNDANIYNQSNLQTDTPAFKKWFGESKMVDAEGKPLVVYHGTTKYFHTFRTSWAEGQGKGVYFSTDKNDTLDFSDGEDGNLIEAYLKMEKPYLDTEDPDFETDDRFWEDVDYRNKMLQEHGYDGVISPQGNGLNGSEILVFDPAQIKSATENNGDFSSDNNDIRFSKSEPSVGEHYTLPAETKPRHQQRLWQDMNNRWTVIQDVIKKAGGVINDANNVYQAMELMPSKAGERIRDYRDTYITPLYDRMTKAGVTLNDLALFNYATHAEERNLAMSKINPRFSIDNGSGMTNQEAIDTLEELKLHYGSRFGELEKLAKEFRAITDDTLNILVDAGVMTQDAVDKMRATYQNYVPLKGFEKVDENGNQTNGTGLGHSTGKAFSKRALGRESKAGQIIENIIRDHERAIVWAEKTEVAKTLGNFVQDFPDDKLWTLQKISLKPTLTPGKREFFLFYSGSFVGKAKTAKDMRRFRDAEIARTGQDKKDYRINVIKADDKVGAMPEPFDPEKEARYIQYGKEVRIQIHDPLALKAFNKLGDQSDNEIFRLAGVMNRFLRQMWTQKNPAFFLINPIRDVQTASIYLTGEGSVTLAGKALKHWGSSWKTMWNHARNKQSSPTEQAILDRYRKSGGMVGTAYISSLDKINEDIHHQLQRFGGEQIQDLISAGKIREAVSSIGFRVLNNKLFDGIENLNTAFECATRLATFKAAVDSGYTDKQAAALALNVTVNFTKKGEYGRELGAMYLFANANIQGNANVFKTLTQSNYRGQAWAIAGSLAVLGFMAAMASGDDGEDELIGDYEKERNLIFDLGEGKRFTIPVAYGWSIFMDLGRAMARAMNGGDTEAISKKLASSFLGNFSPIGNPIPNGELSADNAIVAFAPTFSKPFVMPAVNKTSFGTPLMPESPFKPNQPDSEKVYRKTRGTLYDSAAETLNSVTGGDAVQSGWIDVSPETLKNTWNYLLGGAGRFITDTESMAQTALSVNEESKPESWPIVKTFYKSESIDDYRRRYYEQADRIVKANEQFSAYKKAGEIDKAKEMIRDNGNLIRLKVYSSGVRDKLKAIRDKEDEIRKAGGDIRLLNALESRERKILSDFSAIAAR